MGKSTFDKYYVYYSDKGWEVRTPAGVVVGTADTRKEAKALCEELEQPVELIDTRRESGEKGG